MSAPGDTLSAAAAAGRLQAVFADIAQTRMRGLPIVHRALQVEAVHFRAWRDGWIGVLVTPWTISLALLPGVGGAMSRQPDGAAMTRQPAGGAQEWEFPSGRYAFTAVADARLADWQLCPLISPVEGVASQEQARAVAGEVMMALFQAPARTPTAAPAAQPDGDAARDSLARRPPVGPARRAFLRAVLPGA